MKKDSEKNDVRSKILREHTQSNQCRALILVDIMDDEIYSFLQEAATSLGIALVQSEGSQKEKSEYIGYDTFVTDGVSGKLDIVALVQASVVPILPKENSFLNAFKEFDPMKFEGNAFLFSALDKYLILEKIIRYLENIRYSGDKRTLLHNVSKTF